MSDERCEPPPELRGRDGWHWVQLPFVSVPTPIAWAMNKYNQEREWRMPSSPSLVSGESKTARTWRYLAPVATPAEVAALRAEADEWKRLCTIAEPDVAALRAELKRCEAACFDVQRDNITLRARVAELERIARMLASFAEKAATLDWDEDNNVTWAAVVAAQARAALERKP